MAISNNKPINVVASVNDDDDLPINTTPVKAQTAQTAPTTSEADGGLSVSTTDTQTAADTPTMSATTTAPPTRKSTYLEIFQHMNRFDPDDMRKRIERDKKREKRQALFAAIGDGVTALSNLYFTHKDAPNSYDASKGLTAAHNARWDKVKAERDKLQAEYLNGYIKATEMDNTAYEREWEKWYKQERDKITDTQKQAEQGRKERWDEWRIEDGRLENEINQKKYEVYYKTGEAKIRAQEELTKLYEARAALYNRTPGAKASSKASSSGKQYKLHVYGEDEAYDYADEYKTAVYRIAADEHISTTDVYGKPLKPHEVAAKVERATKGKTRPNGNGNKNVKKNPYS